MGWVAAVAAIAAAAGTVVSAHAQAQNQKAMANAADAQAEIQRQQAARERQIAAAAERDYRREEARRMATLRARIGGSGGTMEGSPLLVVEDVAAEQELNALRIRSEGETRAHRMEQGAILSNAEAGTYRSQVGSTLAAGYLGATSKLAGGAFDFHRSSLFDDAKGKRIG